MWGSKGTAPLIHNLDTRGNSVVSFMLGGFPRGMKGWVGLRNRRTERDVTIEATIYLTFQNHDHHNRPS